MSRSVAWRRTVSDTVSWRQDQALSATIYILRQTGPTGFLLKEEGEEKNFKVFLGDPHKCTCPTFMKERDLCKHICWVILKKFKVPRQNPVTWQFGLVEREINEILRGVSSQPSRPAARRRHDNSPAASEPTEGPGGRRQMEQRPIGQEDVCPICQDELLAKHLPVTFCKFGCGNNVHIKCMKVWAEHQSGSGKSIIECPFCREDFGPLSQLKQELKNSSQRETRAERLNEHLGTTCKKCRVCPVIGKCYRCAVCTDFHLCQGCFNTSTHTEHSFNFRQKPSQRWRPAPTRGQGGLLPDAVINSLMGRDISEDDYDILLQLDSQTGSDLTEETLRLFPSEKVRQNGPLRAPGQQCCVCLRGYEPGQTVRRLPCRHEFHRECIDEWLLHRRPSCPIDGTVYTNESVQEITRANRQRQRQIREAKTENRTQAPLTSNSRENPSLELPGVGIATLNAAQENRNHGYSRSNNPSARRRRRDLAESRRRGMSSAPSLIEGAGASDMDLHGLVVSAGNTPLTSNRRNQFEDAIINMVAQGNREQQMQDDGQQQQQQQQQQQRLLELQTRLLSDRSNVASNDNNHQTSTSNIHTMSFRADDNPNSDRVLPMGISTLRPEDRLEMNLRRQRLSRQQRHHSHDSQQAAGSVEGPSMNISRLRITDEDYRPHPASSHPQDSRPQVLTNQPPSIPLPRQDATIALDVGPTDQVLQRKPPSGGNHGNRRGGRLRSKPLSRERGTDQENTRDHSRDRRDGQLGKPPVRSLDLHIGHSPTTTLGFNSEFLLSSTQSRSSKRSPKKPLVPPADGPTEPLVPVCDIQLAGTSYNREDAGD